MSDSGPPRLALSRAESSCHVGEQLRAAGRLEEAKASYRLAIEQAETLAAESAAARVVTGRSYLGLGRVALQQGPPGDAQSAIDRAVALQPDEWDCAYYSGCARGSCGDFVGAVEAFDRALALAPSEPRIRVQRGYARLQAGHLNEAIADLSAVIPSLDDRGRLVLATLYAKRGEWPRAEALLARARAGPDAAWSFLLLGYVRERCGRRSEAIEAYGQAMEEPRAARFASQRVKALAASTNTSSPVLDAVLLLLGSERGLAIETLQRAHARDPFDAAVAHALFVASYFGAVAAGDQDGGAERRRLWEQTIAAWVILLNRDTFWREFQRSFRERCGLQGVIEPGERVRARIQEQVSLLFDHAFDRSGEGPALRRLLQREIKAAEHLREMGGLAVPDRPDGALACGPLGVRLLGLESALDRHVAPGSGLRDRSQVTRLARYFSMLGAVQAYVDLDRPDEALAALAALACPHCEPLGPPDDASDSGAWLPRGCVPGCPAFDTENPGFRTRSAKEQVMRAEGIELAVEVHVALGRAAVRAAAVDIEGASKAWEHALRLAALSGAAESTLQRITTMVLGRVKSLENEAGRDSAIALLEAANAVCQNPDDKPLTGRLAELLADRGVAAGNEGRWEAAVADLRSAVRSNPHASRPLANLGIALRAWSAERVADGDEDRAESLLAECYVVLRDARFQFTGKADVEEQYRQAAADFRALLNSRAVKLADERQFERSLELLAEALRHFPDDETLAANERNILLAHAMDLATSQRFADAQVVLDAAERRCRSDATLLEEVHRARLLTLMMSTKRG